jgi:hypothetical protein
VSELEESEESEEEGTTRTIGSAAPVSVSEEEEEDCWMTGVAFFISTGEADSSVTVSESSEVESVSILVIGRAGALTEEAAESSEEYWTTGTAFFICAGEPTVDSESSDVVQTVTLAIARAAACPLTEESSEEVRTTGRA